MKKNTRHSLSIRIPLLLVGSVIIIMAVVIPLVYMRFHNRMIDQYTRMAKGVTQLMVNAFDGDRAVGNCSISRNRNHIKLKHRCDLAIALVQEYTGCGLGTILMEKAIAKAREMGFEQIELGVYEDNERGLALYRKMGFKETGKFLRAFKLKDGTYFDEINMVLFL